jgi:hypothetical protein
LEFVMIIAALVLLLSTANTTANPPAVAAATPVVTNAGESPRSESASPFISTRTRAEMRAEAIEAARAAREPGQQ